MLSDYEYVNIELTNKLLQRGFNRRRKEPGLVARYHNIVKIVSPFIKKEGLILDIGAKDGGLLVCLSEAGFCALYGIDISEFAIDKLKQRGFDGCVMDAQKLLGLGFFDTVFLVQTLEHCPEPQLVIENVYDLLHVSGIFYIEVPKQKKEKVPTKWAHYFCFDSFTELIKFFDSRWKLLYYEISAAENFTFVYQKVS